MLMSEESTTKNKMLSLYPKHIEAIEKLKERPGGFNFSQYVQKKLEEDFPEYFD
jgi:hypothetical protein